MRRLLQQRFAGRKLQCLRCTGNGVIDKGDPYIKSTIVGYWGNFHLGCFDNLSINLQSEIMGEPAASSSIVRYTHDMAGRILSLKR